MRSSAVLPSVPRASGRLPDVLTVVDTSFRNRLGLAIGAMAQPVHFDSLADAASIVGKRSVRAVLVGTGTLEATSYPVIRRLSTTYGCLLIAVIDGWTPDVSAALLALGRHGVSDVVDASSPRGLGRLRDLLARSESDIANRVLNALKPDLDGTTDAMRTFIANVVRVAPTVSTAKHLAQELGVNGNGLGSRFHRAHLPSPRSYLTAVRLLYAAAILEKSAVSLAEVATRLHYSSPQSFGRHVREQIGVPGSEFRMKYSFEALSSRVRFHLFTQHKGTLRQFEPLCSSIGSGDIASGCCPPKGA